MPRYRIIRKKRLVTSTKTRQTRTRWKRQGMQAKDAKDAKDTYRKGKQ